MTPEKASTLTAGSGFNNNNDNNNFICIPIYIDGIAF